MCYNKEGNVGLSKEEEQALATARHWMHKLEQEKLAHAGTLAWMRHYERLTKDIELVLENPCEDCPRAESFGTECAALEVIRAVLERDP